MSVEEVVKAHWTEFGRHYYQRYDYEAVDATRAGTLMRQLTGKLYEFQGRADIFEYCDPVDSSVTKNQGLRFATDEFRVVYRLSGTGAVGATVRVYYEKYERERVGLTVEEALGETVRWSLEFSAINAVLGVEGPTVIT